MKFEDARGFVDGHAVAMILDPQNGISGVAVGRKNRGALSGATDYCVTAFVTKKLTSDELRNHYVRSFYQAFALAARHDCESAADIDVVETGGAFQTQTSFSIPAPQRGRFGGNPPALNAQKVVRLATVRNRYNQSGGCVSRQAFGWNRGVLHAGR